jgi:hypothetical protein
MRRRQLLGELCGRIARAVGDGEVEGGCATASDDETGRVGCNSSNALGAAPSENRVETKRGSSQRWLPVVAGRLLTMSTIANKRTRPCRTAPNVEALRHAKSDTMV